MPKYIELEAKVIAASEGQMGEQKEKPPAEGKEVTS